VRKTRLNKVKTPRWKKLESKHTTAYRLRSSTSRCRCRRGNETVPHIFSATDLVEADLALMISKVRYFKQISPSKSH
jgi:hypothetical protein